MNVWSKILFTPKNVKWYLQISMPLLQIGAKWVYINAVIDWNLVLVMPTSASLINERLTFDRNGTYFFINFASVNTCFMFYWECTDSLSKKQGVLTSHC